MTQIFLSFLSAAALVFTASSAHALPITSKKWSQAPTFMMESTFPMNGVVAMSNCSASLVKFKGVSETSSAIVLTNGHCTGGKTIGSMFLKPDEIHHNFARSFKMNLLDQAAKTVLSITATEVIYATMSYSDFALLRLNKTYAELRALAPGIEPLVISDLRPKAGTQITIPSGYWKKTYACTIEAYIPVLKEAGYLWKESLRYSEPGCDTIGGTSGSPVVSVASGEVIAINNTGNEDGQSCTMNNPCEQDENGQITAVTLGASYAQQTYVLYSCLNNEAQFDLSTPGCPLPKGK